MSNKFFRFYASFIVVTFLAGCNAGTTYSLLDDVKLNEDGSVTRLDGERPQKKRIVYHGEVSGLVFYDKNASKDDRLKFESNIKSYGTVSPQRCVFMAWFVPINFWTYFFMSPESLVKQTIKNANNKDNPDMVMKDIVAYDHWLGGLISYDCRKLSGKILSENELKNE